MSDTYAPWAPTKPEDKFVDEEIVETPAFARMRQMLAGATEAEVIKFTRDAIKTMWEAVNRSRFSDKILAVFEALDEDNIEHSNEVVIRLTDDGIGTYHIKGRRKRFSHDDYAKFIGQGTPKDTKLYREAVKLLEDRCGLDASALRGGFLLIKASGRDENKNCILELVLEKGREGNDVCDKFVARIFQYPFVSQSVPTVVFPPRSGKKKGDLSVNDEVCEVASPSAMMSSTLLGHGQTPAVMFGLGKALKDRKGTAETPEPESEENAESADEQPDESEGPSTPSAAHALLDDDDDD